jgi:hypothetical protein
MALLNYTTKIAAGKTAMEIVSLLAKTGARQVLTDYDDHGQIAAISFAYADSQGELLKYRLPVDVGAVEKVMRSQNIPRPLKTTEQAERVAWRILKDWVEAQLAILETGMVVFDQVMLPYMMIAGGTVYELYRNQQLTLGAGEVLS